MSDQQQASCEACKATLPSRIAARCPSCGAERSHRDAYPEQYRHPLCGRRVRVLTRTRAQVMAEGTVERVVTDTRYGPLAYLYPPAPHDVAFAASDCDAVPEEEEDV